MDLFDNILFWSYEWQKKMINRGFGSFLRAVILPNVIALAPAVLQNRKIVFIIFNCKILVTGKSSTLSFSFICFSWKRLKTHPVSFIGVVRQFIVEVEQTENCCHVKVHSRCKQEDDPKKLIEDYLQVHFPIRDYYDQWSSCDAKQFARKATLIPGVRMLKQDPFENVISFICSQNNNISRIGQLVSKLCNNYGTFIGNIHDEDFYSFPTLHGWRIDCC